MCGIGGLLFRDAAASPARDALGDLAAALAHRGPDDQGLYVGPGVGLVHRRLSIIDLEGGHQPIFNEDRSLALVFNGEIYNYRELTRRLEARGHRFRTRSDSEVLVHLYEEKGADLVDDLRGMFAFALWDETRQRLLLARDRLGIKPLYLYRGPDRLLFASDLRALLTDPTVERCLDVRSLDAYLAFGFVPGPRTILEQVQRLQPGHTLCIDRASNWQASPRRYWQLRFEPDEKDDASTWIEEIDSKLSDAVRHHLVSDVPIGAFLSGGIDSGVVVARAAELGHEDLRTFSIGFEDPRLSELPYARQVALKYGTRHREELVSIDQAADIDLLLDAYDEPFADTSAIPTLLVSTIARSDVKVVLSGDGGDEAFAGYARYLHDVWEDRIRRVLPAPLRSVLRLAGRFWPETPYLPRPLRAKSTLQNLGSEAARAYARTLTATRNPARRRLLHPDLRPALDDFSPSTSLERLYDGASGDALARMQTVDTQVLLPDDFLTKVDRASMSVGLEVRPPLLDHELLEVAARLPTDLKIQDGRGKHALRAIAQRQLPPDVIEGRKRGFELPISSWMRGRLEERYRDVVLEDGGPLAQLLDLNEARRLVDRHVSGRADHGPTLWSLLCLAGWADRHLEGARQLPASAPLPQGQP